MKTVKLNSQIQRVSDKKADEMVKNGWNFCRKSEFKNLHKKTESVPKEEDKEVKGEKEKKKTSAKEKRKLSKMK